MAKGTFPFH
jgi:hypothetical protein